MDIATIAATDTSWSTLWTAFTTGFSSCWDFITSNVWLTVIVAVPVALGLLGAVISFVRSR